MLYFLIMSRVARSAEVTRFQFSVPLGFFQNGSGFHPSFYPSDIWGSFPRDKGDRNAKQGTHFHLEPRLRIRGTLPEVPYVFVMGCAGFFISLLVGEDGYKS